MYGLKPLGIPHHLIDVIAPSYYVETLSPREIDDTWVTDYYKIPLLFICKNVQTLFELTKSNKGSQYSAYLDESFKQLLVRTNNKPSLGEIYDMIQDIVDDDDMSRIKWVYEGMFKKIQQMAKYTIDEDEDNQWSAIGKSLQKAVDQSREAGYMIPRWIVFTLSHSEHPEEPKNLAFLSTVLTEIYAFAKHSRKYGLPIKFGVMLDELHTYVRDKQASSRSAIHDLLFAWGRTSRVLRMFITQKDDQLDKVFRDNIKKDLRQGTYATLLSCENIPEPGYAEYLNRVNPNPKIVDQPYYIPKVKTAPPMCCVEDDEPNNEK
jgi:hypothetical protein